MAWLDAVPILLWIGCTLLTENKVIATVLCPGRQVNCVANPCQVASCFAFPQADCVADFCNGCNANFFLGNRPLSSAQCGLSSPPIGIFRDGTGIPLNSPTDERRIPNSSSGRRTSPSSQRGGGFSRIITRRQQINSIRARRRQEAQQQKQFQKQQQQQQRQRQNGRRTRQRSSRPSPRRSRARTSPQTSRNSNRRLGRRRPPSSSSGFLARLLG